MCIRTKMFAAAKAAKNAMAAAASAAAAGVRTASSVASSMTQAGLNTVNAKLAQADQMAKDFEKKTEVTAPKTGGKVSKRKATLHDGDAPELSGPKRSKSKKAKKPRAKSKRAKSKSKSKKFSK